MTVNKSISHSPFIPFDPNVAMYNTSYGHLTPWEYSGWKAESLSWKNGCYLHAGLNPNLKYRLTGPDVMRLLKDSCINDFRKFSVGATKHGVMCNENGNVMADGLILRTAEDEFICMGHGPYLDFLIDSGRYDVSKEDQDKSTFLFQLAGPRSLAVAEAVTGESLRDIEFFWHRPSQIRRVDGKGDIPVRIFRVGVARTLAYEIHGHVEDVEAVYAAVMEAGRKFEIERLGMQAYGLNHTEGGMVQLYIHFLPAWIEDRAFMDSLPEAYSSIMTNLHGSAGSDPAKRFANPVEVNWGHMITFDHEFTGSAALKDAMAAPRRKTVTLEWNEADVLDIYASQFRPGDDAEFMDFIANPVWQGFMAATFCDDVMVGHDLIGMSSGRMFSHYHRKMISLAVIDVKAADIGNEVDVIWGKPGTNQKRIRARVARMPYIDRPFNNDIDTKLI